MTFNFNYAELLGREMQKDRMREAEKERLIKQVAGLNPPMTGKLFVIMRSRWSRFWIKKFKKIGFIPVSQVPKNSHSL